MPSQLIVMINLITMTEYILFLKICSDVFLNCGTYIAHIAPLEGDFGYVFFIEKVFSQFQIL